MTTLPNKILAFYDGTQTVVSGFIGMVEGIFTDTVTRFAPILAPLPPAFAIYSAMVTKTPLWVAYSTAVAIELIGMFSARTAVKSWNWNKSRIQSEPVAPFQVTLTMAIIYFAVVFALAIGVEIYRDALIIIYPSFVIVAVSTYVSNAVSTDMQTWQKERTERVTLQKKRSGLSAQVKELDTLIKDKKTELDTLILETSKRENELIMGSYAANDTNEMTLLDRANEVKRTKSDERKQAILDLKKAHSGITQNELLTQLNDLGFGTSLSTVKRDLRTLNGKAKPEVI